VVGGGSLRLRQLHELLDLGLLGLDDRRSVAIETTAKTDEEVRATLGGMHRRMLAAVEGLSPEPLEAVAMFLTALIESVEEHEEDGH